MIPAAAAGKTRALSGEGVSFWLPPLPLLPRSAGILKERKECFSYESLMFG